ncbi:MAG: DUF308 domain-containing protein [Methanoregulaceae archaeon]|jgi:uncharacterized membrane protein HdeD (DUF308 family)|nr:DUF308 domain-containing protein [Methanoregulaceae archaeon]
MTETVGSSENKMGEIALYPWWIILVLGIAVLILGIAFLSWPYLTLMLVVTFVGAYWFISGIFGIISLIIDRSNLGWKLLIGILGIIAGIVILTYPLYSTLLLPAMLVIFIGVWGLLIGAVHLAQAFGTKDWGSGLLGLLAIIFGILLLAYPLIAVAMLPFIFGGFGVVGGIITIIMAFQFRKMTTA